MKARIRGIGLVVDGDRILLVQHWDAKGRHYWSPPGGGIEEGESIFECAEREVVEETGLKTKATKLVAVRQFTQPHIDRNSIELFFLCRPKSGEMTTGKTETELYFLNPPRFIPFAELHNHRILPEEIGNRGWLEAALRRDDIALLFGKEELSAQPMPDVEAPFPEAVKEAFPEYFRTNPTPLQPESSMSNDCPFLLKNDSGERKVLRPLPRELAEVTLRLNQDLRRRCNLSFGRPLYAQLTGDGNDQPWPDASGNRAFVIQEYCEKHRLDILADIRDLDIYSLGRFCGQLQRVMDSAFALPGVDALGDHPLALPLAKRISVVARRLDPALLDMPAAYAEWICGEAEAALQELAKLGANEFPITLIDRDLNVRNASIAFNAQGTATLHDIFDPDFCSGSVADALRNPSLSFASKTPRLSLKEILSEDVNTIGSPRWVLFLEGFVQTYSLAYEEILAIPHLEKLEILTFRLFEDHPRYRLPEEYLYRFRDYTTRIIGRINNINWEKRLADLLVKKPCFAFPDHLASPGGDKYYKKAIPPVSPGTMDLFQEATNRFQPPEKSPTGKEILRISDHWTVVCTPSSGDRGTVQLVEGYPFPLAQSTVDSPPAPDWKDWDLSFHLSGKPLHDDLRRRLAGRIRERFFQYVVRERPVEAPEIHKATKPLSENRRGTLALFDLFRFKGDALYGGLYFSMLRQLNPSCDLAVISRNKGIWNLFDVDFCDGLSDLPDQLLAAIIPVPMDSQWRELMDLLPPVLTRTRLILIPQRNMVIVRDPSARTIDILYLDAPAKILEYNNIATYTWHGLHSLLPNPVSLHRAVRGLPRVPMHSIFLEQRPIFVNPHTSGELKNLTSDLCRLIVFSLHKYFGTGSPILVNAGTPGASREHEFALEIEDKIKDLANVSLWHGENLKDTANMLSSVRLIVTADTSIGHIAGFKGIPCLVLWNTERWNPDAPLDMIHNGPVGFSVVSPTLFNATFTKTMAGVFPNLPEDAARIDRCLELMQTLYYAGKGALFQSDLPVTAGEMVARAEQALERAYSAFDCFPSDLRPLLEELALGSTSVIDLLKPVWRNWLDSMPVPLKMSWVIDRLRCPEKTGWETAVKQERYALELWRVSPLRTILAFPDLPPRASE